VDITANRLHDWVETEKRRKRRADRRDHFFYRARGIFYFLLVATIFVFAFSYHMQIQTAAAGSLAQVIKKSSATDSLRQKSLNYEKEVDDIAK